jgi:uncharacterized membrane protein (UPF0136 family)
MLSAMLWCGAITLAFAGGQIGYTVTGVICLYLSGICVGAQLTLAIQKYNGTSEENRNV